MNQGHTEKTKFWAGGLREFHELEHDKESENRKMPTKKGIIGWWHRFVLRMVSYPAGPGSKEIDERLFIKKSTIKND